MARPDLEDAPVDDRGRPVPPASPLEGPEWSGRRSLTSSEEEQAWKIAKLTAVLMGSEGVDGAWPHWADAVRCGASLLEISRRHVIAEADGLGDAKEGAR